MDGPTCCLQVKELLTERGYDEEELPYICILTAYQEKSFENIAIQSQANLFLTKPIFKAHMHKLLIQAGLMD